MDNVAGKFFFRKKSINIQTVKAVDSGFSLLEILVVLALMMILIYGATPKFNHSTDKIREEINETNIKLLESAAQVYRLDTGIFPSDLDALLDEPQGVTGWRGPYLEQWPQNPYDSLAGYELDSLGRVQQ